MTLSVFGNNVNEYYVDLVRKNFEERTERLKKIRTRAEAEEYIGGVREKIRKIFRFPERTELNAQVTARHSYGEYTVENIIYFSRPGYPVTANVTLQRMLPASSIPIKQQFVRMVFGFPPIRRARGSLPAETIRGSLPDGTWTVHAE